MAADSAVGTVYFLHDFKSSAVKIGFTADLVKRTRGHMTSNPNELVLLGTIRGSRTDEARLHDRFKESKIPGRREWFRATPDVLRAIRQKLLTSGTPRTVEEELQRRGECRYGLKGVRVALTYDRQVYEVRHSDWDRAGALRLCLVPPGSPATKMMRPDDTEITDTIICAADFLEATFVYPPGTLHDVPASDCYLMSDWPIVCRCWMDDRGCAY